MNREHQDQADAIVAAFKDLLREDIRNAISDAEFSTLAGMIRVTLSKDLKAAVTQIEEVLEGLKSRYMPDETKAGNGSLSLGNRPMGNPSGCV